MLNNFSENSCWAVVKFSKGTKLFVCSIDCLLQVQKRLHHMEIRTEHFVCITDCLLQAQKRLHRMEISTPILKVDLMWSVYMSFIELQPLFSVDVTEGGIY